MEREESMSELAAQVADAIGRQAELQIEVLRAEIARDTSSVGRGLRPMAFALPLLLIGYVFVSVAAALTVAPWLGLAGGTALVGFLNLVVGAVATRTGMKRLQSRHHPRGHSGTVMDAPSSAESPPAAATAG